MRESENKFKENTRNGFSRGGGEDEGHARNRVLFFLLLRNGGAGRKEGEKQSEMCAGSPTPERALGKGKEGERLRNGRGQLKISTGRGEECEAGHY